MSGNVSENVELGQLPQPQECYADGHQEDECEKEDKEEEMSLLGENDGAVSSPPVQIVVAARPARHGSGEEQIINKSIIIYRLVLLRFA